MRAYYYSRGKAIFKLALLGSLSAGALTGEADAASQGTLGSTSTGSVNISVSVPSRARITGLTDITITNQDPGTAINSAQNICVWSNTATRKYTIAASGSGMSNAFTLANGSLNVPYSVQWSDTSGATTGTALTAGTASVAFTSTATDQACATGARTSASLIVNMATSDLATMQAATAYSGVLTLVVTPQ
ncbi:hypothetical protein F9288_09075 [Sphingomonas sp. CL5.1]|uniref:hypothetical protein n=1 Tax=Sphingomonas sp. CL5.1 TaxID=2653203 RepID=UPI0015820395|nr:hypothetical protein [Sphingomonas sp. CL5.1]QKR99771.1 hypothetical protein F9288_09075 [Sphingomonas sp. CL5.1]